MKAFDTVAHQRLLAKLDHSGIRGHLLTWLSSFLTGRRQRVVLRNGVSDWIKVTSGVPQGSILGPLLFLIFVNDLPNIASSTAKLFADDTKLYRQIKNIRDCDILQDDLNEFSAWSKIWLINFNALKCIVLRIREAIRYIYTLDGVNLESVDSQKDLGVTISKTLKPATHIDIITKKAYQKIGMIKRCFTNFTEKKVTTLYQSIIRPALEYASPVWNPWYKQDIDKLEKVQRKCLQLCSKEIELDSLDKRRKFTDCVETYKFVHNQYKTPASMYFKQPARELRGHSQKLMKQYSRTDIRKNFFSNRVVDTWNSLQDTTIKDQSMASMKQKLRADL